MRISDWSSDVCSSDLLVARSQADAAEDGRRGDADPGVREIGGEQRDAGAGHRGVHDVERQWRAARIAPQPEAQQGAARTNHPADDQDRRRSLRARGGSLCARRSGAGVPPPGAELWLHARSEEHTSELQSLMRISYAVFCLKKIKN